MPVDVVDHLRNHPRRPVSLTALIEPPRRAAWREVPTTVVLGDADDLVPATQRAWVVAHVGDTRIVDCDHFLLFRNPGLVAATITEAVESQPGAP